jgi:16S rRNA (guanine527-N7)-methyltransferase
MAPAVPPGGHLSDLDRLAELIAASPHNLVAVRERQRVRDVHVPESAAVGAMLPLLPGARWLDLGTGGGLPGLVLAVLHPGVEWTLLDATGKKVAAVRSFIAALELANARPVQGRAERLGVQPEHQGRYDGVVSRAVARLPVLMELGRGFLKDGGLLASVKGPRVDEEIREAERIRARLGFGAIHKQRVAEAVRPTMLVTMRVQGHLPRGHTRRSGLPAQASRGRRAQ